MTIRILKVAVEPNNEDADWDPGSGDIGKAVGAVATAAGAPIVGAIITAGTLNSPKPDLEVQIHLGEEQVMLPLQENTVRAEWSDRAILFPTGVAVRLVVRDRDLRIRSTDRVPDSRRGGCYPWSG